MSDQFIANTNSTITSTVSSAIITTAITTTTNTIVTETVITNGAKNDASHYDGNVAVLAASISGGILGLCLIVCLIGIILLSRRYLAKQSIKSYGFVKKRNSLFNRYAYIYFLSVWSILGALLMQHHYNAQ